MEKRYPFILFFSLSLFIILGLIRIILFPLNFWVDEMFHVFAAQGLLATGQPLLPSGLFYNRSLITSWIVATSFQIFGISEYAARLPFLLIGAGAILVSYILAKEIFDQRVALVTVLLLAISPWQIYWSTNARMYILLQFVYVLFIYFMYLAWNEGVRHGRINHIRFLSFTGASLVMIALAFQLHDFGILFVGVGVAFLFLLLWEQILEKVNLGRIRNTTILFIIVAAGIAILVFLINPFGMLTPKAGPIGMQLGEWFYILFFGRYFPVFGLFAAVALLSFLKRSAGRESLLLIGFFIPLLLLSLFLDQKNSRYIFFLFPLLVILASYGITVTWDWYQARKTSATSLVVPLCIGLLLLMTVIGLIGAVTDEYHPLPYEDPHPHWNDAAAYVGSRLESGDVVVSTMPVCTLYYLGKTDYWLRQNEYYAFTDEEGIIRDRYTGAIILTDYAMVESELSGKNGWLIADRKLESYFTSPDVLSYVGEHMRLVSEGSDDTVRVYRFEKG